MSKNARCSMPGNSAVRAASAARCSRATAASWLACPKVNSRKKIPSVEGAYTSSNTRGVPPARNTSTSSMLSAPQIMPPMIVVSFPTGLTAPDFTRVDGRSTCLPINHERPVCSASSMIGTKPAADTRFGSSNIADPTVNACDDCTGNAFRTRDYFDFENRYCPSSGGIFAVHTPITNDRPSTDSGLVDRLDDCARTDLPVGEDVGAQAPPVDQAAEHALRGEAFQVGARLTQALAQALDVSDTKPTSDQSVQVDPASHDIATRLDVLNVAATGQHQLVKDFGCDE